MNRVKVQKEELLEKLRTNRSNHRKIFDEAMMGYREEVIEILEHALQKANDGREIKSSIIFDEPVNQTRDYDRAIGMLEMSVEDEIELSTHEYQCYVMDDWEWKHNFMATNTKYLS